MQRLKGLNGYARYAGNRLICDARGAEIISLFTWQNRFDHNENLGGGCMQLGWNTVGIFDSRAGRLMLVKLYKNNVIDQSIAAGTEFNQVATRAVDTCTFVHVIIGGYHILAHLDVDSLCWGYRVISQFKDLIKLPAAGLCSHIYAGTENRFSVSLSQLCEGRCAEIYRHNNNFNFRALNEDDMEALQRDLYLVNKYGHMEIGLSCEQNGIVLFGDITNNSNNYRRLDVPTRLFESRIQLLNIYNNDLINPYGGQARF